MARSTVVDQLSNTARLLAFRGVDTGCTDLTEQKDRANRGVAPPVYWSPDYEKKVDELRRATIGSNKEAGVEVVERQCRFSDAAGREQDVFVIARIGPTLVSLTGKSLSGVKIPVEAFAFMPGRDGKEIATVVESIALPERTR